MVPSGRSPRSITSVSTASDGMTNCSGRDAMSGSVGATGFGVAEPGVAVGTAAAFPATVEAQPPSSTTTQITGIRPRRPIDARSGMVVLRSRCFAGSHDRRVLTIDDAATNGHRRHFVRCYTLLYDSHPFGLGLATPNPVANSRLTAGAVRIRPAAAVMTLQDPKAASTSRLEQQGVEAADQAAAPLKRRGSPSTCPRRRAGSRPASWRIMRRSSGSAKTTSVETTKLGRRSECTWVPAIVVPRASGWPAVSAIGTPSSVAGRGEALGQFAGGAARGVPLAVGGVVDDLTVRQVRRYQQRGRLGKRGRQREVAGGDHADAGVVGGRGDAGVVVGGQPGCADDDGDAAVDRRQRVVEHRLVRGEVHQHVDAVERVGDPAWTGTPIGGPPQATPRSLPAALGPPPRAASGHRPEDRLGHGAPGPARRSGHTDVDCHSGEPTGT